MALLALFIADCFAFTRMCLDCVLRVLANGYQQAF
jgi:hypothetical protein